MQRYSFFQSFASIGRVDLVLFVALTLIDNSSFQSVHLITITTMSKKGVMALVLTPNRFLNSRAGTMAWIAGCGAGPRATGSR